MINLRTRTVIKNITLFVKQSGKNTSMILNYHVIIDTLLKKLIFW